MVEQRRRERRRGNRPEFETHSDDGRRASTVERNGVTIVHRLPYSAITFLHVRKHFDAIENEVERRWNVKEYQAWEVTKRLVAGAFAGCFSCTLTYPLDLVRARLAAPSDALTVSGDAQRTRRRIDDDVEPTTTL